MFFLNSLDNSILSCMWSIQCVTKPSHLFSLYYFYQFKVIWDSLRWWPQFSDWNMKVLQITHLLRSIFLAILKVSNKILNWMQKIKEASAERLVLGWRDHTGQYWSIGELRCLFHNVKRCSTGSQNEMLWKHRLIFNIKVQINHYKMTEATYNIRIYQFV